MNPIWRDLPLDLAEYICNKLPSVRRVHPDIKARVLHQKWMFDRLYKNCTAWYGEYEAYYLLLDDLNLVNESDFDNPYSTWVDMSIEKRTEYYKSIMD